MNDDEQFSDGDNPDGAALIGKVRRWLEMTGYPLEMRVAEAAWKVSPNFVTQGRNYVDPLSGAVRETDVIVGLSSGERPASSHVYLVIECKSKPSPWVIFDDGSDLVDNPEYHLSMALCRTADDGLGLPSRARLRSRAFANGTLLKPSRTGHGLVEALTPAGKTGERNAAWDAVRASVSAAHGVLAGFDEDQLRRSRSALVAFPVVVTSGGLFRAYLAGGVPTLEEIDVGAVVVRLDRSVEETRCLIVTETALPKVLEEAAATPGLIEAR